MSARHNVLVRIVSMLVVTKLSNFFSACAGSACDGFHFAEYNVKIGRTAAKKLCAPCMRKAKSDVGA